MPPQFLYPYMCVYAVAIYMYVRKRQFCQVEAMKMRDSDRKVSLHHGVVHSVIYAYMLVTWDCMSLY